MALKSIRFRYAAVLISVVISACSTAAALPTPEPRPESTGSTITIGDISDEPKKKIDRFQPLADYLAANMSDLGFGYGRVAIASNVTEMTTLVASGQVDLYFDSPFPALSTRSDAGTQFILRRWKDGSAEYRGVIVAAIDSGIETAEHLRGRVAAAEEPYSTTGFAVQSADLIAAGFQLQIVPGAGTTVPPEVIGVWFSRDEENIVEAIVNGSVPAGFLSDQDLAALPPELRSRLRVVSESEPVPRQVVSIRGDLDQQVAERIRSLLLRLEDTEEGRVLLDHTRTARFDEIPPQGGEQLAELSGRIDQLP